MEGTSVFVGFLSLLVVFSGSRDLWGWKQRFELINHVVARRRELNCYSPIDAAVKAVHVSSNGKNELSSSFSWPVRAHFFLSLENAEQQNSFKPHFLFSCLQFQVQQWQTCQNQKDDFWICFCSIIEFDFKHIWCCWGLKRLKRRWKFQKVKMPRLVQSPLLASKIESCTTPSAWMHASRIQSPIEFPRSINFVVSCHLHVSVISLGDANEM